MILNGCSSISDLCGKCKNFDICKYALTGGEAAEGLKVGDGSGPFTITIDCKYRDTRTHSNTRALNLTTAVNYGE